jgi:N-glycosidase YbiA
MKTHDLAAREVIRSQPTPGEAQRCGRCLVLRPEWKDIRIGVMERLVRDKFTRHADLGLLLRETGGRELIEGNDWDDRFWGVSNGTGLNHLGRILMGVRAELLGDLPRNI